jgi:nucleoside-diphosphate-sugar epimerase
LGHPKVSGTSMPHKRALVTGASGFIGRHLVDRLLKDGSHVIALVRSESRLPDRWRGNVISLACQDWTPALVRKSIDRNSFDVVFHLAAYGVRPADRNVDEMTRINVEVPAELVRLCKDMGARLVMAGTFSEYQEPAAPVPLSEEAPLETRKIYGSTKAAGGLLAHSLAVKFGVPFCLLRLFKVYGAGEAPYRLLPTLVAGLIKGQPVALSAGTQILDFVYVKDVVEAFLRTDAHFEKNRGLEPAIWNVCTDVGHEVHTFATTVAQVLGANMNLLRFGEIPMRQDDEPWLVGSADRLRAELGWRPEYDLRTGIEAALAELVGAAPAT